MKMTISRAEFLAALSRERTANEDGVDVAAAFPNVDPGNYPFGSRVMVQLRLTPRKSRGGIVLPGESQDAEKWNTGIAQIVALGPLAFKKRDSMQPWPEGAWCAVGDFVRVPKFGGDRWEIAMEDVAGQEERTHRYAEIEAELQAINHGEEQKDSDRDLVKAYGQLQRERDQLKLPLPPIMVMFAIFNDVEMIAVVLGNPCEVRVYI